MPAMSTVSKLPRRRASKQRLPTWLLLCLAILLVVLAYGIVRPTKPSAFDSPEAQMPMKGRNPWEPVKPM